MKLLEQILKTPRNLTRAISFAYIAFFCTHASNLWAGSGQVLDEATKKPLAGVFVYAAWSAKVWNPVISANDRCIAFTITQTDDKGKFNLQDFSWNFEFWLPSRTRAVGYYLAGYELVDDGAKDSSIVYLRRTTETTIERLKTISLRGAEHCLAVSERKILVPLYRAKYDEANRIASSEDEKKQVIYFRDAIDRIELGDVEFDKRRSKVEIK